MNCPLSENMPEGINYETSCNDVACSEEIWTRASLIFQTRYDLLMRIYFATQT